ncbi:MAG: barstar family protein [Clostridia bacterium]|nr:barstar family protein [Clostridia bacterium]
MKTALIDGRMIFSSVMLHESLKKQLSFPDWYGMNLDALHDMLTQPEKIGLVITNTGLLKESLGARWESFIALIEDCQEENPRLKVLMEPFES